MKTVLVTGANRGLGLEFARQYAADGWRVLATSRRQAPELAGLAGSVQVLPLDVADLPRSRPWRRAARREHRRADQQCGLPRPRVLDGGGTAHQRFGAMDYADWEYTLKVNVLAPMKMAECFVELARSTERKIVTLTSMLGSMELNTTGGLYAYRSSKAAVNAVMKSMSIDLGRRGILPWRFTPAGYGPTWAARADIEAPVSVSGMRRVIASLKTEDLGHVYAYDGARLPY